ncbi:MAG: 1,4-alpha-glucan branching protein [Bacteroidota bacterium]|nr:1,4-alpha-glucan branching protein [Bacteroidota bacterium]
MAVNFPIVQWAQHANIYEVNIRQYTTEGTFLAFRKHLPRLQQMGVDILWLMPITPISKKERQGSLGSYYACSSYTSVNPEFGTLEDFGKLVKEAHALGMKVIIDWVANHTGWDHHWTIEHPDWMMRDADGHFIERNGWKDVIDLNYENEEMRKAMIEAMLFWVKEYDIDGFRCDMAHLVPLDFWQDARLECDGYKSLYWLAECEVVEYHDVFDTTYAWWWMHVTEKFFQGNASVHHIMDVLHAYSQYPKDTQKLFFTSNHDENSWNGTEYEKYGQAAKAMAVFTCTWAGMPLIYSGQETASDRRLKFFDKDMIDWKEPLPLQDFYTTLLHLHKSPAVSQGETFILPTSHDGLMAYVRRKGEQVLLVILNLSSDDRVKITVEHEWVNGLFTGVFSKIHYDFNGKETFELQAGDYLLYEKR